MPKVTAIVLIYNSTRFIKPVFEALVKQDYPNLEVVAVINGDTDGSEKMLRKNYPSVKIVNPNANLYFSAGNNLIIRQSDAEFILLINHDLVLEPDYTRKMAAAFADPKVGAATGKLLRYDFSRNEKTKIIDSTGINISKSGRAKDRGQLEEDRGQYDGSREVFGVTGAGPMYRKSALEQVRYCEKGRCEYFDEDFVAYWEDVDLSWRLNRAGYRNVYVPEAVSYHGRTAGQAKGGYLHLLHFIRHHKSIPAFIRRLNYRNHILMYLKNTRFPHPAFLVRELIMFFYVLVFEPSTLKVLPDLFKLIPKARKKFRATKKGPPGS